MDRVFAPGLVSLEQRITEKSLHYGDPPNVGCCAAGATMNSIPLYVIQFWKRGDLKWERVHGFETFSIEPDWARDA